MAINKLQNLRGTQEYLRGGILRCYYGALGAALPADRDTTVDGRLTLNEFELTISDATDGTFQIVHNQVGGSVSAAIDHDANAATIQAAMEAMSAVGSGGVSVTGSGPFVVKGLGRNRDSLDFDFLVDGTSLVGTGAAATLTRVWSPFSKNYKDGVQVVFPMEGADAISDLYNAPEVGTMTGRNMQFSFQSASRAAEWLHKALAMQDAEMTRQLAGSGQTGYRTLKPTEEATEIPYFAGLAYGYANGKYVLFHGYKMGVVMEEKTLNSTKGAADDWRVPTGLRCYRDDSRAAGDQLFAVYVQEHDPIS